MAKLFLLFVIMPILEIAVLIHVGEIIGGWNTVALVILSALIGAHLVRREGLSTLAKAQAKMQSGQVPAAEIGAGLMLLVAGILLVTPGFITDIFGLLLTLPVTRNMLAGFVVKHLQFRTVAGGFGTSDFTQSSFHQSGSGQDGFESHTNRAPRQPGDIIDGEVLRSSNDRDRHEPRRLD